MRPEEWEKEALVGSEVDKLNYHMEHFPIGPAVYGYAMYARAQQLGLDKWEYIGKAFEDIKAHHMNTVWFGNTGSDKGDIDRMIALAEEKGLRLMLQMSGAYYRCTEPEYRDDAAKRRRHFEEVNVPFVRDVMPKYRNRKGLFAWSVKEETKAEYARELAAYYKLVKELDPTHPILICFFFVIQGVASYVKGVDLSREGTVGASMIPRGWRQDPGANTWSGWLRYYPPQHCMKLQVWAAVALGAKGIFSYCHGEPTWGKAKPDLSRTAALGLSCDPSGQPAPQWAEFADAAKDIRHVAPLLLRMNKRVRNLGACDDPNALVSTFQEEDSARRYLIVVNKRTGFWCKDSPKSLKPSDEMSVDSQGQLTGYMPAPPLEFVLKVEAEQARHDLRTLSKLPMASSFPGGKSYRITLPPGEGNVLLLGSDADLLACRKLLMDK